MVCGADHRAAMFFLSDAAHGFARRAHREAELRDEKSFAHGFGALRTFLTLFRQPLKLAFVI